jgi:hypothetical protein
MEIFPNQSLFLGIFPKMCLLRSENCSILCQNGKTTPAWGGLENLNHNILIFGAAFDLGRNGGNFHPTAPDLAKSAHFRAQLHESPLVFR